MSLFRTFAPLRSLVARPQHQLARVAAVSGASQRWTSGLAAGAETEEGEFAPVAEVTFESSEPTFMTTLTFSEKGVQAMLMEDVDREKSVAKIIALLGGRLQSYFVTTTGDANAMLIYTVPKNHDVQTLVYTLMGSGSYTKQSTTKLMAWKDAANSLRASRSLYSMGAVSCNISNK